eukprot:s1205_g9.t1
MLVIYSKECFAVFAAPSLQVTDDMLAAELQAFLRQPKKLVNMPTDMKIDEKYPWEEEENQMNISDQKDMAEPEEEPKKEQEEQLAEQLAETDTNQKEQLQGQEEQAETVDKSWVDVKDEMEDDTEWWDWEMYEEGVEEEEVEVEQEVDLELEWVDWKPAQPPQPKKMPVSPAAAPQRPPEPPAPPPGRLPDPSPPSWGPQPPATPPPWTPAPPPPPAVISPQMGTKAPWAWDRHDKILRTDRYGGVVYKSGWYKDSYGQWWPPLSLALVEPVRANRGPVPTADPKSTEQPGAEIAVGLNQHRTPRGRAVTK